MSLRPYQARAIRDTYAWISAGKGNPLIVLPTGAGKSHVIAQICRDVTAKGKRALVLAHRAELLEQNAEKLRQVCETPVGVFSATLGLSQASAPVVVAGIQSVYRRGAELGAFRAVVVDEAHLIPEDDDSMYRRLLSELPGERPIVVGLTATPFRTKDGAIYGEGKLFAGIAHNVSVQSLMDQGFLSPLKSKGSAIQIDVAGVRTRRGDFEFFELEKRALAQAEPCVADALARTLDRRAVLLFCTSVNHGQAVAAQVRAAGMPVSEIYGNTDHFTRTWAIDGFRKGRLKYLVNCDVLTTGFDAPNVDAVVLLRPTQSPGLYYQMVGRGLRLAPGKTDCLVLDYGANIVRHGPITHLVEPAKGEKGPPPTKTCPSCGEIILARLPVCPDCGHVFPSGGGRDPAPLDPEASEEDILGRPRWVDVFDVAYDRHEKPGGTPSLCVSYLLEDGSVAKEWICLEHEGYAAAKAHDWWLARTAAPPPATVEAALDRVATLRRPAAVRVAREGKFLKVKGYRRLEDPTHAPT